MMKQVHSKDPTRIRKIKKIAVSDATDPAAPSSTASAAAKTHQHGGAVKKGAPAKGGGGGKVVHSIDEDTDEMLSSKKIKKEEPTQSKRDVSNASTAKEDEEGGAASSPVAELMLVRSTSAKFAVLDPVGRLHSVPSIGRVVEAVLQKTPTINRMMLSQAAEKMYRPTRRWLRELGRTEGQSGVFITLEAPLRSLKSGAAIALTKPFTTDVGTLQALASQARITYISAAAPNPVVLRCVDPSKVPPLTPPQHLETQLMMISGPALLLYDGNYDPIPHPPLVYVASLPGINFAYCDVDIASFTHRPVEEDTGLEGARVIHRTSAMDRMKDIWLHVLVGLSKNYGVEYAVMCAIGCGAFRGKYGNMVPRLWGAALCMALATAAKMDGTVKCMKAVFVTLPTFGTDTNFAPFKNGVETTMKQFQEKDPELYAQLPPVILVEDASMISIAQQIAATGSKVGMLNPSDVQALRHGWIGMYWDGGHIALEEILAMQTTILTQHIGLNKALYTQPERLIRLNLPK